MVRPRQNLDPNSQPWARSIEADIDLLLRTQQSGDNTLNNSLKGLSTSLTTMGRVLQTLAEQQEQLTNTVQTLTEQQNYLTSLKSRNASVGGWSTSSFSADGLWHWDPGPTFSLAVPTGKVRVFVRASNALASTNASAVGILRTGLTYAISGGVANAGDNISYVSGEGGVGTTTSAPIVHIGTVVMPPGTYAFTGYRGYQCFSSGANKFSSVANTSLIVEVVNPD